MKPILREPKAQRWRMIAVLTDGTEVLLCLGGSIVQVRELYAEPWFDLPIEVRGSVHQIQMHKWEGLPDAGTWIFQCKMPLPQQPVQAPV